MNVDRYVMALEGPVRLGFFLVVFALMALWEVAAPRRRLVVAKAKRWISNISLVVLNTVLLRIAFPTAAIGAAWFAHEHGWGILNYLSWAYPVEVVLAVIVLDLAIYLQHVMFHAVPVLWRLHRVHHADLDFDVTTGARFHPVEILLSMCLKFGFIFAVGPPLLAVLIFEILLSSVSMFNHSNITLPGPVDRRLRWVLVTPDMHRVHHSIKQYETDSNFGFNLPWWDRLCGTYRPQPEDGHTAMTIGIEAFRDPRICAGLVNMLKMPFKTG